MEDIPALLNQLLATAPSAARPSTRSWEKSFILALALLIHSVFWVSQVSIRPNRKVYYGRKLLQNQKCSCRVLQKLLVKHVSSQAVINSFAFRSLK